MNVLKMLKTPAILLVGVLTICVVSLSYAKELPKQLGQKDNQQALAHSVDELRHVIGEWSVVTQFLSPKGDVAQEVNGTYQFYWVVEDRVVSGRSDIPTLGQSSAILFYINEEAQAIEMSAVGKDGKLWIMTGKLGEDSRETAYYSPEPNVEQKLRFTRFNVKADSFESKMEYTLDRGDTWTQGNHQLFTRK